MCLDTKDKSVLQLEYLLTTSFLCGTPTSRSTFTQAEKLFHIAIETVGSKKLADIVLGSTINHKIARKYPRNAIYVEKVLKWLSEIWTKNNWSGAERFSVETEAVGELNNLEIGYKSYFLKFDTAYFTLLESFEGITQGTTGLNSWGAANVLASWCLENPEYIDRKNVLELGAGIGYTAASVLSALHPSVYTATDYHPHVLSVLHHNVELLCYEQSQSRKDLINFCSDLKSRMMEEEFLPGESREWTKGREFWKGETRVKVLQLDWRKALGTELSSYDVILAADVVYATHLFIDLVKIIRELLTLRSASLNKVDDNIKQETNKQNGKNKRKDKFKRNEREMTSETKATQSNLKIEPVASKDSAAITAFNGTNTISNKYEKINLEHNLTKSYSEVPELRNKYNNTLKTDDSSLNKNKVIPHSIISPQVTQCQSDDDPSAQLPLKPFPEIKTHELHESKLSTSNAAKAFVACTQRNLDTISEFLDEVINQDLKHKLIFQTTLAKDESLFSYNESYKPVKIYEITL